MQQEDEAEEEQGEERRRRGGEEEQKDKIREPLTEVREKGHGSQRGVREQKMEMLDPKIAK